MHFGNYRSQSFHEDLDMFEKRLHDIFHSHKGVSFLWRIISYACILIFAANVYMYLEYERVPYNTLFDRLIQLKWPIVSLVFTFFLYLYGALTKMKSEDIVAQRCRNVLYNYKLEYVSNGIMPLSCKFSYHSI